MMYDIIFDVLSAWQVIAVGLLIMIVLPIVFYFASFDKTPVKIKRIPDKKRAAAARLKSQMTTEGEKSETDNTIKERKVRRNIKDYDEEEAAAEKEEKSGKTSPANKKKQ